MLRWLFRFLRLYGDGRAIARRPGAYAKRRGRRAAHRRLARWLR